MSYSSNQIQDFIPNDNFKESEITQDKSLGSKANQIFDKQKKLREALVELIRTCYNDIHQTADNRQKSTIRFNDRYLIPTILGSLKNIDQEQVQRTIEDIILENFVDIKTFDQVKLKKQVLDILKENYSEKEDKTQEIDNTKTEIGSVSVNIDAKNTLDLFNQMLENETLMNSIVEKIGGRIIECGDQSAKDTLKQLGKIEQDSSSIKIKDTQSSQTKIQTPKTMSKSQKRRQKRLERKLKKEEKIRKSLSGLYGIINSQIENVNNSIGLAIIPFTNKSPRKYGFFKQNIRNTKAFLKKKQLKIKNIGRKVGLFKVEQKAHSQHSKKMQFLKNYNNMLYKWLIGRIGEFDKAVILGKPQKKKILKKFGLGVWSAVKWIGGKVWGLIKGVAGTLWNLSKKIFSLVKIAATSVFSKLKYFIFTPAGAYVTGFIAGIIWHKILKPILDWGKEMIDKLLNMMGFESLDKLMESKEDIYKQMRNEYLNFVNGNADKIVKAEQFLTNIEILSSKLENFNAKIENFGKNATGKAINTACSTVGVVVGSFFGPVGAIVGGALGKAVGMTAEYFYKQIPDKTDDKIQKNLIIQNIRKRYQNSSHSTSKKRTSVQIRKINEDNEKLKEKIEELERKQKDDTLSSEEKKKNAEELAKYKKIYNENEQKKKKLMEFEDIEYGEDDIKSKIDDMYQYVSKDANFLTNTDNFSQDFQIFEKTGKLKAITDNGEKRYYILQKLKKDSFMETYNMMIQGKISPSQFITLSNDNLKHKLNRKMKGGSREKDSNIPTVYDYIFNPEKTKNKLGISEYKKADDFLDEDVLKIGEDDEYENRIGNDISRVKELMLEHIVENINESAYQIYDSKDIEEMLNSQYAKKKMIEFATKHDMSKTYEENYKKPWNDFHEMFMDISKVYGTNGYQLTEQDYQNIATTENKGFLTSIISNLGKAISMSESDPVKRAEYQKQMDIALGRLEQLKDKKKIEEDEKKKKAEEDLIEKKKELRNKISELENEQNQLLNMPSKRKVDILGIPISKENEIETDANAENDGSNIVFGEWRGMTGINPMNLNFKSGK